jgi:two-component system response regulator AtoC
MEKVLIIDDDPAICSSLSFALSDSFEVLSATDPREALYYLEREDVAVTILDLRLGPVDGLQVLREIRRIDPRSVIIVLTAYGTIRSSVEAMKGGAFYYLTKPVDSKELKTLIERGVEIRNLYKQVEALSNELRKQYEVSGIVGRSKAIHRVLDMVDRVKDIESNVVVLGESGTGKELVARALHFCGYRREQPFQVVNCAAIPEALLESELFGHVKGAFTGASYSYEGKLRAADGGTVFFDEIGEMPLSLQAKVLRFLQDRTVTPIGSLSSFEVNVRVIAATNRDLERLVHEGLFREDLFYRLNVIVIEVPPLRERKEDIPILGPQLCNNLNSGCPFNAVFGLLALQFPPKVNFFAPMHLLRIQHRDFQGTSTIKKSAYAGDYIPASRALDWGTFTNKVILHVDHD